MRVYWLHAIILWQTSIFVLIKDFLTPYEKKAIKNNYNYFRKRFITHMCLQRYLEDTLKVRGSKHILHIFMLFSWHCDHNSIEKYCVADSSNLRKTSPLVLSTTFNYMYMIFFAQKRITCTCSTFNLTFFRATEAVKYGYYELIEEMFSKSANFSVDTVRHYGASNVTLEELYLKLGHDKHDLIVK